MIKLYLVTLSIITLLHMLKFTLPNSKFIPIYLAAALGPEIVLP